MENLKIDDLSLDEKKQAKCKVSIVGGLANQMFQVFACLAYCKKYNMIPVLKHEKELIEKYNLIRRPLYWDSVFKEIAKYVGDEKDDDKFVQYKEPYFHYKELPKMDNPYFFGHFTSYKYFDEYFDEIVKDLKLDEQILENAKKYPLEGNEVSLHYRIGDYKHIQYCHPLMSKEYYCKALKTIKEKTNKKDLHVLVFGEKSDEKTLIENIKSLQNNFPECKFELVDTNISDIDSFFIMSRCKHHIIANSTFSYWSALLGKNKNKIVVYPELWFGPTIGHKMDDMFPTENWHKI